MSKSKTCKRGKRRISDRINAFKRTIKEAMETLETRKLERPACTISIGKKARQLQIVDEKMIPINFWIDQDPKLDKKALLNSLKAGNEIEGVQLDNGGETISFRKG